MTWPECPIECQAMCCEIISFPPDFIEKHKLSFQVKDGIQVVVSPPIGVKVTTPDGQCVFLDRLTWKCTVYEERPNICREFGQSPKLLCPYFSMEGVIRTPRESKRVIKYMDKVITERMERKHYALSRVQKR